MSVLDGLPPGGAALTPDLVAALASRLDLLPLSPPRQHPARAANRSAPSATPPTAAGVQPMLPTMAWDWSSATTGTTDPAQFYLVDTMPASADPQSQYLASGTSMSSAYAAVVDLISTFPNPRRLEQARTALHPPPGPPADTSSPPGWTKVPDGAGILRWQPDWVVTETPTDWLSRIAGSTQAPTTLRLSFRDVYGDAAPAMHGLVMTATPDAGLRPLPLRAGELHELEITARAWGRINVYPGSWYDPSIVALGRYATFHGDVPFAEVVGPRGLLQAQVTGLLVAADPQVALTVDSGYAQRNADRLRSATAVQVAGWQFRTPAAGAPPLRLDPDTSETTTLVATSAGAPPQIAGVYVRPMGA